MIKSFRPLYAVMPHSRSAADGAAASPRSPAEIFLATGAEKAFQAVPGVLTTDPAVAPAAPLLARAPLPAPPSAAGLTWDQALAQYVGEFGRGQIINFVLASLVWVPNAMLILLLVFSVGSPVKDRAWACVDQGDVACAAVLASSDPTEGFCGLRRAQWRWTAPTATLTAQFDLVCGGEVGQLGAPGSGMSGRNRSLGWGRRRRRTQSRPDNKGDTPATHSRLSTAGTSSPGRCLEGAGVQLILLSGLPCWQWRVWTGESGVLQQKISSRHVQQDAATRCLDT
jgi:hypothetical protein